MANKKMFMKLAFLSLFGSGIFVFLLGIAVFVIGLVLTHGDDFNATRNLKAMVRPQIDYVHYWVGLPLIITGISITCSAFNLRKMRLTICTLVLSLVCVVLSLAGLVVDGPDFSGWKEMRAKQTYWENQSGYACSSVADTCVCTGGSNQAIISNFADCGTVMGLSTLFGVLIASMVFALVILLAVIFIMVYVITTKREKARRTHDRYTSTKMITVSSNDPNYPMNPIYDPGPKTNRGYEVESIPTQGYADNGRSNEFTGSRKINDDTLRIQDKEGIVMMDPGRFKLGDDDIY